MLRIDAVACPNPKCKELTLSVALLDRRHNQRGVLVEGEKLRDWQLLPASTAKPMPDYVPRAIVEDYNEACAIVKLSPKASATLARRALQGMLLDYWKVKRGTLFDQINEIKDRVDSATWDAIDSVRKIGNIGAHMENNINVIVDVEPEEAEHLIWLIETLINYWYVDRHQKAERLKEIKRISEAKQEAKKAKPAAEN